MRMPTSFLERHRNADTVVLHLSELAVIDLAGRPSTEGGGERRMAEGGSRRVQRGREGRSFSLSFAMIGIAPPIEAAP